MSCRPPEDRRLSESTHLVLNRGKELDYRLRRLRRAFFFLRPNDFRSDASGPQESVGRNCYQIPKVWRPKEGEGMASRFQVSAKKPVRLSLDARRGIR